MQTRSAGRAGIGAPTPLPFTDTELYNISRCGPLYIASAQKYLAVFTATTSPHYATFYTVTRYLPARHLHPLENLANVAEKNRSRIDSTAIYWYQPTILELQRDYVSMYSVYANQIFCYVWPKSNLR